MTVLTWYDSAQLVRQCSIGVMVLIPQQLA